MSIPASHIKFSDDRTTAWLVVSADPSEYGWDVALNRPCDTCDGTLEQLIVERGVVRCPDCHGSGRHCFEIEVRTECTCERRTIGGGAGWYDHATDCPVRSIKGYLASDGWHFVRTLTVSVVEGMVVGLYPYTATRIDSRDEVLHATISRDGSHWTLFPPCGASGTEVIMLPDDAAPGMTAVRLNVHTPIGAGS